LPDHPIAPIADQAIARPIARSPIRRLPDHPIADSIADRRSPMSGIS
jgi:hypothetical protein